MCLVHVIYSTFLYYFSMSILIFRTFIRFLCQIDQEKQISPEILKEIDKFNSESSNDNNYLNDDNDDTLSTTIQLYNTEYLSNFSNFMDLQQEIKRLRDSKFQLINTTNTEINDMRDTIKLLMNRILHKLDPNSKLYQQLQPQNTKKSIINRSRKTQKQSNTKTQSTKNKDKYKEKILHDYNKLGKDNVVNVFLMGTKCSGKTALLRNMICLFGKNNDNKNKDKDVLIENIKNIEYIIINAIISSIYDVLSDHDFFESDKYKSQLVLSERMKIGINYFKNNRLSKYDGPFLTKEIVKHINSIFNGDGSSENDDKDNDDQFIRLVFMNDCYYRNMYYFYHNIDKYCKSTWYHDISSQELLLIWDKTTLPIYYFDINLDDDNDITHRFWDISSDVIYNANVKYKENMKYLIENVKVSCILWLTSPIFNYQIEKEYTKNKIDQTSMRKSMKYFQDLFENTTNDVDKILMEELKEYKENENDDDILKLGKLKWKLTPIITLFNKCDIFKMDIESSWDESKTILLTFPEYDGEQTYDAIINYIKIIFKSFKMNHKRPFHIYETIGIDENKIKSIVHHIKTMTNLHTINRRLSHQISKSVIQAINV